MKHTPGNSRPIYSRPILRLGLFLFAAFLVWLIFSPGAFSRAVAANPTQAASDNTVFLPLVTHNAEQNFQPATSIELAGGDYHFATMHIAKGVTVTVTGAVTLTLRLSALIEGALLADCSLIQLESEGDLTILGTVDNRCQPATAASLEQDQTPGALTLSTRGELQIGSTDQKATVETDGDLILSNDPDTALWRYDLPAEARPAEPVEPVCSSSADSLWNESPATINFYAQASDPDGGDLTYTWDFGDGSSSAETSPSHDFLTTGAYTVTLTVSDDEGQQCLALLGLNIDDVTSPATLPAVAIEPDEIILAVGTPLSFLVQSVDAQDDDLAYHWDFGDGTTSTILTATHIYTDTGRWMPTLTVTDSDGNQRRAQAAVYLYDPPVQAAAINIPLLDCPVAPPAGNSILVNGRVINIANPAQAAPNRNGRSRTLSMRGNVVVPQGVVIRSQDGGDSMAVVGRPLARGRQGGRGGSLDLLVNGKITFCTGSLIASGNGGDGGDATATAAAGDHARAVAGNGGAAADHLRISATNAIVFEGATTIDPGAGGNGGNALATGDGGVNRCTRGQDGAGATAIGGNGGRSSKFAFSRGNVVGLGNVTIDGGAGGNGGAGESTAGKGGDASCPTTATGGTGKNAYSRGGDGGEARFIDRTGAGLATTPFAFTAGDGGEATATGGAGGAAVATPPAACSATTASGGMAGLADARAGKGGKGRLNGFGGSAQSTGGAGGSATATGGDCTACMKGGDATANGGKGGDATARFGKPQPILDTTTADAGDGGMASALGGKGGDCPTCPSGKGGAGGNAKASGGAGGTATGNSNKNGGDGGKGDATGGKGGKGATCCNPPKEGGNGGNGGTAKSVAGSKGLPNGMDGGNATSGGNGGDGGDGEGPGNGGAGGVGEGIPFDILDGVKGKAGEHCPKPTPATITPVPDPTLVSTPTPTATATPPTICTPGGQPCPETATPTATPSATATSTATSQPTPTLLPTVEIELVELSLRGTASQTMPVTIKAGQPFTLEMRLLDAQGVPQMVDSFFDIFFEIQQIGSSQPPLRFKGIADEPTQSYFRPCQFETPAIYVVQAVLINKSNGEEQRPPGVPLQIVIE